VRLLLAALLLLPSFGARAQDDDAETQPVQRKLAHLQLGDHLDEIQRVYLPAHEWPSERERKQGVNRIRLERSAVKYPEPHVDVMYLGMKRDRLVEIQIIYDAAYTRTKSVEALAGELSLIYGEPRHSQGKFWWSDNRTVLRVFDAEVPSEKDGAVEFRTSIQVMDAGLFEKAD
jgi:hypothetical protein